MAQKILFVFNRDFPPKRASETNLYFCFFKDRGFNPKMFCAKSNYDDPDVISGGIESKSLFLREFVFAFNLTLYILKHHKDIQILYLINLLMFCQPAIIVARLFGIKTIFDLRTGPITDNKLKHFILKMLDQSQLFLANKIVTIDLTMLKNIYGKCFLKKAVELPEGFRPHTQPIVSERQKPFKYVLPTTLGKMRRIDEICDAFLGIKDHHLYIYGDGDNFEELVSKYGKEENIHFMGYVLYNEVIKIMPQFDYGISFIPKTDYYEYQPPLKTIEYLGAGLPVIATGTHGNLVYVNETNGVIINDTCQELRNAIQKMPTIKFDRKKIRDSILKFSWDNILEKAFNQVGLLN